MEIRNLRDFTKGYIYGIEGSPEVTNGLKKAINVDPTWQPGAVCTRERLRPILTEHSSARDIFYQKAFSDDGLMVSDGYTIYDAAKAVAYFKEDKRTQFFEYRNWIIIQRANEKPWKYKPGGMEGTFVGAYTHPWERAEHDELDLPWAMRFYQCSSATFNYHAATNVWEREFIEGSTPSTEGHDFVCSSFDLDYIDDYDRARTIYEAVPVGIEPPEYTFDDIFVGAYTQVWEYDAFIDDYSVSWLAFGAEFTSSEATRLTEDQIDAAGFTFSFPWEDFLLFGDEQLTAFLRPTVARTGSSDLQVYLYPGGGAGYPTGAMEDGVRKYAVTFVSSEGAESNYFELGSVNATHENQSDAGVVIIDNLPISSDPQVIARKIYRTCSGLDVYKLRTTIPNNLETGPFLDETPDTQLGDDIHSQDHNQPEEMVWGTEYNASLYFLDSDGNIWWPNNGLDEWEYFASTNYVAASRAQSDPKCMWVLGAYIVVFMEDAAHHIYRSSDTDVSAQPSHNSVGSLSDLGIYRAGGAIYIAHSRGLFSYSSEGLSKISLPFMHVFSKKGSGDWDLNHDAVGNAVLVATKDRLLFSYPGGGGSTNSVTLLLDLDLGAAKQIDQGCISATVNPETADIYIVDENGAIFMLDKSYTSGTVDVELETMDDDLDSPNQMKKYGTVALDLDTSGKNFTFKMIFDDQEWTKIVSADGRRVIRFTSDVERLAHRVRFNLSGTDVDGGFKLYNIAYEYELMKL